MQSPDIQDGIEEIVTGEKNDTSGNDSSSDEEKRDYSLTSVNGNQKCQESPLHSLELEFITQQRLYTSQYFDKQVVGLCCGETEKTEELGSKTIKAATHELSSPRIMHKGRASAKGSAHLTNYKVVAELSASLSESSRPQGEENKLFSTSEYKNYPSNVNDDSVGGVDYKGYNLQTRRRQTNCGKSQQSQEVESDGIGSGKENHLSLRLSPFSSHLMFGADEQLSSSPTERRQFFKSFSHFVQSGEDKLHNVVYYEDQLPSKMVQHLIWLELLAWHRGCSIDELRSILSLQQQAVPSTISEVLNFSVKYDLSFGNAQEFTGSIFHLENGDPTEVSGQADETSFTVLNASNDSNTCTASGSSSLTDFINDDSEISCLKQEDFVCECSDTLSQICQNCVDQTTFALQQVESIIHKIDHIEGLYPSLKSLAENFPACNGHTYICHVKTLNLWLNITRDLRQKINLLAKLLGIKNRVKAGWPYYRFKAYDEVDENVPLQLTKVQPSLSKIKFSMDFSESASTSGSDSSEQTKSSFPSSPEVQVSNPFDVLRPTHTPSHVDSCQNYVRSIYRKYVDRTLRHKGLRWMYKQIFTLVGPILYRIHATLKKPKFSAKVDTKVVTNQGTEIKTPESILPIKYEHLDELSTFGVWSECFQLMALPTFHKPFFFLLRVLLDVVHECLRLRLEQQSSKPSALSVGQLIKECKEVLRAATSTRRKYINLAQTVLGENGNEIIEAQVDAFNYDLEKMLQVYLGYLEYRMLLLQNVSHTQHHKSYLEEEWAFVRIVCPHIPGGEALASKKFCFMASYLLRSIGICLTSGVNDHISAFEHCFSEKHNDLHSGRKNIALQTYRNIKHLFQESSEQARQVITLAKSLRKDLEIGAEFTLLVSGSALLTKLRETGHIRVTAPNISALVIFAPGNLQHCERYIWQLVDMTCGHEPLGHHLDQPVYLLMIQCSKTELKGLYWDGPTLILDPSAEANVTLSHIEVDGLLLVVNHSSQLTTQCKKFQNIMGNTVKITKQETSCNHAIAGALADLKNEALKLWQKLTAVVKEVELKLDVMGLCGSDDLEQTSLLLSYRDVVHQGYKFAFEYQKAVSRLITGEARNTFYASLASFADLWMKFVIEKCEEGRGLRPVWVKRGLSFLVAVYDSPFGQSLSEEEFEAVQQKMNKCIRHLLACAEKSPIVSHAFHSPKSGMFNVLRLRHQRIRSSLSVSSSDSALLSPPIENITDSKRKRSQDESSIESKNKYDYVSEITPIEKVRKAIEDLEMRQQAKLLEKGAIGQVSSVKIQHTPLHVGARRVTFPWQRCFKIGEGRFGKVYTAVNNSTGELIALKEIRFQPNDHRVIKEALDEIRIFEGIKHPNLVRYYGVEVHREEMLIFMEYCSEGSLESAIQLHLPESLIRKYTRLLLDAVNVLHENSIVHRDIKSANIFLTSDGNLKLGDFGCSIKLKNNTTMPGELCASVGTPAYMAPEVFTKNIEGGHGRAADVWSIGCVVLEMLSAKRPWHDKETSYQIMYAVGTGGIPEIPKTISDEGQDFLSKCLVLNPRDRWITSQLLDHPFTKVQDCV